MVIVYSCRFRKSKIGALLEYAPLNTNKSLKLGFDISFIGQGYIGKDPENYHLWESKMHISDSL